MTFLTQLFCRHEDWWHREADRLSVKCQKCGRQTRGIAIRPPGPAPCVEMGEPEITPAVSVGDSRHQNKLYRFTIRLDDDRRSA